MEKLNEDAKLKEVVAKVNEIIEKLNEVSDRRGPKSQREMTDEDARNILVGELAKESHKSAAEKLNLSYAQVYSCRKEFTFKHIHKEIKDAQKSETQQ